MTFQDGNGSFAAFAKEVPRANSVFNRVSPNPSSGFGMNNQGGASAPAPSASTTQHRILYPEHAMEFGNLQLQAPPANITPADLGNAPRSDSNRTDRNPNPPVSSTTFGGSQPFPSKSNGFNAQPATYATTSHVLPGFGGQPQQQPSTTSPPQHQQSFSTHQQSRFGTQQQPSFSAQPQQQSSFSAQPQQQSSFSAQPQQQSSFSTQPQQQSSFSTQPQQQGFGQSFGNQRSSFGATVQEESYIEPQQERHTGMTPVSQDYEQKPQSFTSAPQKPALNNLTQQENKHVEQVVTVEQIDALMKYFAAANFATSGFLDILAEAGEKFVVLRNNYKKLNLSEAHNPV